MSRPAPLDELRQKLARSADCDGTCDGVFVLRRGLGWACIRQAEGIRRKRDEWRDRALLAEARVASLERQFLATMIAAREQARLLRGEGTFERVPESYVPGAAHETAWRDA